MTAKSEKFDKLGVICRICLKGDNGPMSSIFTTTENDDQPILAARITSIAHVQVSPNDGLPSSICQSCHQQVDKFYDFRLLVEISDRALRSYLDGSHENHKISSQSLEDVKDLACQGFLMENALAEDSKDFFAVNTLLVPSGGDTEVWRICSVERDEKDGREEPKTSRNEINILSKSKYATKIIGCSKEESTEDKRGSLQRVQPVAIIKNIQDKEPMFFTTTADDNDNERISNESEELTYITIIDDENNEDHEGSLQPLNKYSCQLCLKPFNTLKTLKNHVKDHCLGGKERIQLCEIDKSVRSTRKSQNSIVDEKMKLGKNTNPFVCPICDRVFQTAEEFLSARDKAKADETKIDENSFTNETERFCENCGSKTNKESMLHRDHAVNEDSSLTCTTCKKHFRNAQSFKMHLKRHTLGSRFSCVECGKRYYSNSELARHTQLHTGMREYPCHLCEMSFFSKPELNRHSKYHKGEKKFECKICFKTYYESGHLKVHQRVHTGERPFACTVCDKAFVTKSKLVRHCKIHERKRSA